MTFTCGFSIIEKGDGIYGRLSLDSYMIRYASERFLDIELVTTGKKWYENTSFICYRK